MEALDFRPNSAKSTNTQDLNGKPKRVFQNTTIHKQFAEYHELKGNLYKKFDDLARYSYLLMGIGIVYLIFLFISIFIEALESDPVAVLIANLLIF